VKWKPDWHEAGENLTQWWKRGGPALCVTAPRRQPAEDIPKPAEPDDIGVRWTNQKFRCSLAEHLMANTFLGGEAFPFFNTQIGPGSLGTFLGAEPHFAPTTVWYEPCISDPDTFGPIRFDPDGNKWWEAHLALIDEGLRRARGRYLVGMPDLIENLDTLAAMRGTQALLLDLVERPAWVHDRLAEINEAFFAAFDLIYKKIRDEQGGNAFGFLYLWGPGKTAKVQCDLSAMISPQMFDDFVVPHLSVQCDWLDYSMYHLDGSNAAQHLDSLLAIESLDAIEFTPEPGKPGGGSPKWYDLYRRIKEGGKAVQAIGVKPDEVVPLLDAVGPEGLFIQTAAPDQAMAERVVAAVELYR